MRSNELNWALKNICQVWINKEKKLQAGSETLELFTPVLITFIILHRVQYEWIINSWEQVQPNWVEENSRPTS